MEPLWIKSSHSIFKEGVIWKSRPEVSLQEVTRNSIIVVPDRYVRLDQDLVSPSDASCPTIPTINMKALGTGEAVDYDELMKLHSACKEWGLFKLVNHGVNPALIEKFRNEIEEFFNLPLEEKMKYRRRQGEVEGYGQTLLLSEDQKLDWCDRLYMTTNPTHKRKPYLFPELPSSLRETMELYFLELQNLAMRLLKMLGKALGVSEKEIEEMFEDGMQSVRLSYYPPCPQPELVMGLRPHSDATAITILMQVNGVDGLQVKKNGAWVPMNLHQDAFAVNAGDILEIFSNGVYKSAEHRATVNSMKERISIAMFFYPKDEAEVGPSTSLINQDNQPLFKRVGMHKYIENFFSRNLAGKSYLEQMKI